MGEITGNGASVVVGGGGDPEVGYMIGIAPNVGFATGIAPDV